VAENDIQADLRFGEEMIMPQAPAFRSIPTKILLPMDFSPSSDAALAMATDLAQHFRAQLHLLHVVPMLPIATGIESFPDIPLPFEVTFLQESKDRAEQQMGRFIAALASVGVKASSKVEIGNDVVDEIMMAIESEQIDMVVLSTHGISGWRPLIFGSTTEKLVRLVQCPLLLLHSVESAATGSVPDPNVEKAR
jgi:nucleotide-binding universal stress UspA family protein